MLDPEKNDFDLNSIVVPDEVSNTPDDNTQREIESERDEKAHKRDHRKRIRDLEYEAQAQALTQRRAYAKGVFWMVCVWLFMILLVAFLQGFNLLKFQLDSSVMIALIATTTANVIAVLVIVIKFLFPITPPPAHNSE